MQHGAQTVGSIIAGTADFILEAASQGSDEAIDAVADPAGFMIIPEGDGAIFGQFEGDVGAVIFGVEAIVVAPAAVEGGFVLVITGRQVEGSQPDVVLFVVGELAFGAGGVPFAGAAELGLEGAGNGDAVWRGDAGGIV